MNFVEINIADISSKKSGELKNILNRSIDENIKQKIMEELSKRVTIYTWNVSNIFYSLRSKEFGHVALQTHTGGDHNQGHYISFWPNADCSKRLSNCNKLCSHFHSLAQDTNYYYRSPDHEIWLYDLNIAEINTLFERARQTNAKGELIDLSWDWRDRLHYRTFIGFSLTKDTTSCSGLVYYFLEKAGLNHISKKHIHGTPFQMVVFSASLAFSFLFVFFLYRMASRGSEFVYAYSRKRLYLNQNHKYPFAKGLMEGVKNAGFSFLNRCEGKENSHSIGDPYKSEKTIALENRLEHMETKLKYTKAIGNKIDIESHCKINETKVFNILIKYTLDDRKCDGKLRQIKNSELNTEIKESQIQMVISQKNTLLLKLYEDLCYQQKIQNDNFQQLKNINEQLETIQLQLENLSDVISERKNLLVTSTRNQPLYILGFGLGEILISLLIFIGITGLFKWIDSKGTSDLLRSIPNHSLNVMSFSIGRSLLDHIGSPLIVYAGISLGGLLTTAIISWQHSKMLYNSRRPSDVYTLLKNIKKEKPYEISTSQTGMFALPKIGFAASESNRINDLKDTLLNVGPKL